MPEGGITALLGANGAGKTTTLKAISNLLRTERGEVTKGSIVFEGQQVQALAPDELVGAAASRSWRAGAASATCPSRTIWSPARSPGATARPPSARDLDLVYDYFSRLKAAADEPAPATRRAASSRWWRSAAPDVAAEDDPARRAVHGAGAATGRRKSSASWTSSTASRGVSFLLAEQNTNIALRFAKYGYILESGRVVLDGEAAALRENEDVKEFYLGIAGDGRKSFKDVKHYKRRKRWLA